MIDINQLTLDELYALNDSVCNRIDALLDQKDREKLATLRQGIKIQFNYNGTPTTGRVIKLNRKTALIASEDGAKTWKVALGLIKTV
jgi:hypothetical protein